MKAVDTNVIVRYLMKDDPRQAEMAQQVMAGPVLLPHTVLQEVAWVLTRSYGLSRAELAETLEALLDVETVMVNDDEYIRWAIARSAAGGDFADMLHVATAHKAEAFVTFDRDIKRRAGPHSPVPVETLAT